MFVVRRLSVQHPQLFAFPHLLIASLLDPLLSSLISSEAATALRFAEVRAKLLLSSWGLVGPALVRLMTQIQKIYLLSPTIVRFSA